LDHFLRLRQVEAFTGLARSTIYELIAAKKFPRPIPLSDGGRRVAWSETEIQEWQQSRISAREQSSASLTK
jgi:prophage regulatory protein